MANAYKRLGAIRPADTSENKLYEVPTDTEAIGHLHICNQDTSARTYSVAVTDTDAAADNEDWIASGVALAANARAQIDGISIGAGYTIRVVADAADKVSFVLMGVEIS